MMSMISSALLCLALVQQLKQDEIVSMSYSAHVLFNVDSLGQLVGLVSRLLGDWNTILSRCGQAKVRCRSIFLRFV